MKRLSINAPAKINLGLNIVSKRSDGFHNLETFFYPIYDLYDTIIFERNLNFIFDSNNSELIKDPNNLILEAHTILEDHINKKLPIKIFLDKKIPMGAGLGGGSSDAAVTLLGLNEFFNLEIELESLKTLALELGSDVPFFLNTKPSIGYSRGEILKTSNNYINKPILIVNPRIHISTKEAFTNITPEESAFNYTYFLENEKMDYDFLSGSLTNDFENYVFSNYPEIKNIKDSMIKSGAVFSLMSGTGSTVYGIFNNELDANEASNKFPTEYFKFISN